MSTNPPSPSSHAITVQDIVAPAQVDAGSDDLYKLECNRLDLAKQKLINEDLESDIEGRKKWRDRIFGVMIAWLAVVTLGVGLQGSWNPRLSSR